MESLKSMNGKTVVVKGGNLSEERTRKRISESAIVGADKSNYSHMVDLAVEINRTVEDYRFVNLNHYSAPQTVELPALALAMRLHASELAASGDSDTMPDPLQIVASLSPILFGRNESKLSANHMVYNVIDAAELNGYDHLKELFPIPATAEAVDDSLGDDSNQYTERCEDFAEIILGIVNSKVNEKDGAQNDARKLTTCICIASLVAALRRLLIAAKQRYGKELSFQLQDYIDGINPMRYSAMGILIKRIYQGLYADTEADDFIDEIFN